MGELVILLLIVLLVFGASRLPQIGEGLGKAIKGLKRGLNSDDDIEVRSHGEITAGSEQNLSAELKRSEVVQTSQEAQNHDEKKSDSAG